MDVASVIQFLGIWVLAAPAVLLVVLGGSTLVGYRLQEATISRFTFVAVWTGLIAAVSILVFMLASGSRHVEVSLGNWMEVNHADMHVHFSLKFVFDRLSIPFVILSFVLCGTVSAFANSYLHRELGYRRFFIGFAIFLLGMIVSVLAGTIETLFAGWELVGLSSALLVAYFQEREAPLRSGIRVWSIYRISDAAFLVAAVVLHHMTGQGDFDRLMGHGPWPFGEALVTPSQALIVGLLLLVAAAGKSALLPFSDWLPRAMEGPTPSSAIFYGALSVHLGAYLLLRVSSLLEASFLLSAIVVALGLATAVFAAFVERVQTDIKSSLSYASMTQVGLIVAEIGLGLRYLALVHIIGHSCLRTLQLLRAPNLIRDFHELENATGSLPTTPAPLRNTRRARWRYALALQRGMLDPLMVDGIVKPFLNMFELFDRCERRWTDWITGAGSRESDHTSLEEPRLADRP